jgi:hypothetical protein
MAGGTGADRAALCGWAEALGSLGEDPVAELLALVWGPSFDRQQALSLLARLPRPDGGWAHALDAFGDHFDSLPPAGQGALRSAIRRMSDNAACRASS